MMLECSIISDVGLHRGNNEDNFYMNQIFREDTNENHIEINEIYQEADFIGAVFDGMGGESNGEIASLEAARLLTKYQNETFEQISNHYISEANQIICNMMEIMNTGRMGSTLAIIKIMNGKYSICNVGDSPVYLFREGKLQQQSVNHNEAQRMFDMGLLSKGEMRTSKQKHRLTQHLGIFEDEMIIEPYILEDVQLQEEDYLLLCSDGLTDMVCDEEIESILQESVSVQQKAKELVETALENGGRDNITVLLLCYKN